MTKTTSREKILDPTFYARPVLEVAPDLLGKYLVREQDGEVTALLITEVEAYNGPEDLACHAAKGRTKRTEVMFGPAGVWYVYLIYGMYDMLNIVTDTVDYPAAVLIRGVAGISGPGRLTKALNITRTLNQQPASLSSGLWIEDRGHRITPEQIRTTPRIGVDYAGDWASKPWRFVLNEWGSQ